jgi:FMN phosphatase YigB (HAD superfamily)
MVGDSLRQDVDGALAAGMRAILLNRGSAPHPFAGELVERGIRTIQTLDELPSIV